MPKKLRDFKAVLSYFFNFVFGISILGLILFVADFGFDQSRQFQRFLIGYYIVVLTTGVVATILRYVVKSKAMKRSVLIFDGTTVLLTLVILLLHFFGDTRSTSLSHDDIWVKLAIILTFVREFSEQNISYKRTFLNPAQLFVISFLSIIVLGSFLLMLPRATYDGISFIDALFTSTSAVCVTGLIVVDTATHFTTFGQSVILTLIQAGGIGILTFASYFSYFFKGKTSYENQLTLSNMTGSNKIGEVFSTFKKVILITLTIETFSASIIFFTLDERLIPSVLERIYFSAFHSISAFCNAGFSTLSGNLFEEGYKYNYPLQLMIIFSFVLGGLGFPIVVNLVRYVRYFIKKKIAFFTGETQTHQPWLLNLNSRITLITTSILIIGGTLLFYINEYYNTLSDHSGFGKVVTALFGATSPRTAGFNTVDMTALNFSTVMLIFLLMWIGASPASTGGGIKTNTFAIATLNFISLAKGKTRIEVFRREIADISVRRAFATITLSLVVIGIGIILISIFDSEKSLISIAFECFSAYSTSGLSIGITAALTTYSKVVIIVIMFVGRVSMLTIMIAIIKKVKQHNYRYPTEEVTIN
ncbi:TrkH family potassium uptake protein [Flavobacterium ardleyense]|uniref:TrkH family potassium uptake protein n=1 Tax=Flavobacterium ardleyense TaxID=2038737 RepID=UPI00298C50A9|nr:potassium transporter TrkG [Flavobacterium ardleyense]